MVRLSPPPGLFAATVLFWGWQTGLLVYAVPLAALLAGAALTGWRWAFSDKDFTRLSDLTNLVILGLAAYFLLQHGGSGLFLLAIWLPVILLPLVAVQRYSEAGSVALRSLFLSLRRSGHPAGAARVDLSYPYLLACLIAAGMQPNPYYFYGVILLVGWGLATVRPRRYPLGVWLVSVAAAAGLAYAGQAGLRTTQLWLEDAMIDWLVGSMHERDPYRQRTALGQLGELKLSSRILYRVEAPADWVSQGLNLRQASYNYYYRIGTWRAQEDTFQALEPAGMGHWQLGEQPPGGQQVRVLGRMRKGQGLLPVPGNTVTLTGLAGARLQRNPHGTLKMSEGPHYIDLTAQLGQGTPRDAAPRPADTQIPAREQPVLDAIAARLGLAAAAPNQAIAAIEAFFAEDFAYSLVLSRPESRELTPIAHFLQNTRQGHCEYFATATVLLLRAAGIPARYAVGYAVQEYDPLSGHYLLRRRHAHAWALAYVDGRWQAVDTTPAIWAEAEAAAHGAWWEPASDVWAWVKHLWSSWRWRERADEGSNDWLLWLLVPLLGLLFWRLYGRQRIRQAQPSEPSKAPQSSSESPFNQVIEHLQAAGYERRPGEPLRPWLQRANPPGAETLLALLPYHQRLRFAPRGLEPAAYTQLQTGIDAWLSRYP